MTPAFMARNAPPSSIKALSKSRFARSEGTVGLLLSLCSARVILGGVWKNKEGCGARQICADDCRTSPALPCASVHLASRRSSAMTLSRCAPLSIHRIFSYRNWLLEDYLVSQEPVRHTHPVGSWKLRHQAQGEAGLCHLHRQKLTRDRLGTHPGTSSTGIRAGGPGPAAVTHRFDSSSVSAMKTLVRSSVTLL
jgi:hypothetical protein